MLPGFSISYSWFWLHAADGEFGGVGVASGITQPGSGEPGGDDTELGQSSSGDDSSSRKSKSATSLAAANVSCAAIMASKAAMAPFMAQTAASWETYAASVDGKRSGPSQPWPSPRSPCFLGAGGGLGPDVLMV